MKTKTWTIALLCCLLLPGCNNDILHDKISGNFWIKVGEHIFSNADIDYYDFSTHTVYFKEEQPFLKDLERGGFAVYVGDTEIYKGSIHPMYLSSLPTGPYISPLFGEHQYTLTISLMTIVDQENEDPRSDSRIVNALKSAGQYHAGLQVKVQSIRFLSKTKVEFDFQLSNPDTFDYLYLDPDKMGIGLFHYFTNGLTFWSEKDYQHYTHQISVVHPEPWDSWKKEWMSVIRSGKSKRFTITYNQFDSMPDGNYRAFFCFPGLGSYHVQKEDINQREGRIWLGEICTTLNYTK